MALCKLVQTEKKKRAEAELVTPMRTTEDIGRWHGPVP